jgi:type I restriction enzyme, S subunit
VGEGEFKDRAEKARHISEATFKRLHCTEIFESDCLISRLPEPVGRSCLLPPLGERMITAVDCTIARFDRSQVEPAFFIYYSQSDGYLKAVEGATSGTTRKRISRSNLGEIRIPVPPLKEQWRIIGILDEVFEGLAIVKANAEQNHRNVSAMFESRLEAVFNHPGSGWLETTVGETCTLKSGTTVSKALERPSGDVAYVKVADMSLADIEGRITTSSRFLLAHDVQPSAVIPEGATIFPKRGGAIHTNKKRIAARPICADLNIMAVVPSPRIDAELLYLYFLNVDMKKLGTGSSIPQINNYDVSPLRISFPRSLAEQKRIAYDLRELRGQTQRLSVLYQRKIDDVELLKKALLHQAFTGKL